MKNSTSPFGWSELVRTVAGLLTCLGLALSSACSSPQSVEMTAYQTPTVSPTRAAQFQSFIHPGTDAQITEKNGRVSMVHVDQIDNRAITGKTSEGRVTISLADIAEARVRKDPSNSMHPSNSTPGTSSSGGINAGKVVVVVIAAVAFVVLVGSSMPSGGGGHINLNGWPGLTPL